MPYVTLVCGRAKRICEPHWQVPLLPHTNGYGPLANGFSSEFAILYLAHWSLDLDLGPLNPGWMQVSQPLVFPLHLTQPNGPQEPGVP